MAATELNELDKRLNTPTGVARWPYLSNPDTQYSDIGDYKVDLLLPKDKAIPIIKQINTVFLANVAEEESKSKGKEIKKAKPPFFEELDDNSNPTGNIIIRFKCKAKVTNQKTQKTYENKPSLFDAETNLLDPENVNIGAGSEIRVNAEIIPYFTALIGAGVTLRLKGVQVIKLVERMHESSSYGFEKVEGYTQTNTDIEITKPDFESVFTDAKTTAPQAEVVEDVIPEPTKKAEPKAKAPDPKPATGDVSLDDLVDDWT